jgi:type VI secretion system protein ImpE
VNDADALFKAGELGKALEAQTAAVRAAPADIGKRWFLAELLCFAEERERADRMLDVIGSQSAQHQLSIIVFRQLLRAEEVRRQVMLEGRAPDLVGPSAPNLRPSVGSLLHLRLGRAAEAAAALAAAPATVLLGQRNGAAFEDFRDLDDVLAPLLEFVDRGGEYRWTALADIVRLEMQPAERPRDLIWRPARIEVRDGPDGEVWLPSLYVPPQPVASDSLRLGRETDWLAEGDGPVRGVGLRTFLIGEEDISIHELGAVEFAGRT